MHVGSATKHNVADLKLVPAAFPLPPPSPLCNNSIPKVTITNKIFLTIFITISQLLRLVLIFWFRKTAHLSSGSISIWLSNRQQHCPSPAQKQELLG